MRTITTLVIALATLFSQSTIASESPQRDLYKLDYCDFCFNNLGNPRVVANHVKYHTGRKSDGSRLLRELNIKIQEYERTGK